jgi:hypothetical protein
VRPQWIWADSVAWLLVRGWSSSSRCRGKKSRAWLGRVRPSLYLRSLCMALACPIENTRISRPVGRPCIALSMSASLLFHFYEAITH